MGCKSFACVLLCAGMFGLAQDLYHASPLGFMFNKHSTDLLGLVLFQWHVGLGGLTVSTIYAGSVVVLWTLESCLAVLAFM